MQSTLTREKPDLLFNNPLKQKVYVFLKNNPGKSFEMFQTLTDDSIVSRQQFNEVEQAIKAREERDRPRESALDLSSLFLKVNPFEKAKPSVTATQFNRSSEKGVPLKKFEKKKLNALAKQYIQAKPDCNYLDLVNDLGFQDLTKPHFFAMKTQLRKKGLISEESRSPRGRKPGQKNSPKMTTPRPEPIGNTTTIEILESIDAKGFSAELIENYKHVLFPILKRLLPDGDKIKMVMLSDPPIIELRKGMR